MNARRAVRIAVCLVVLGACTGSGPVVPGVGSPVTTEPIVYAAVGASETVGVGTNEPLREAWPRVLWRTTLPGAVYLNMGIGGSTTRDALIYQVPTTVAFQPDIVTVWLNVNDLLARVPVRVYARELDSVVDRLRSSGASVFVANTPKLDTLPAYLACRPSPPTGGPPCFTDQILPSPARIRAAVAAYNRAIAEIAVEHDATVVDLYSLGNTPALHPEYVSADGFHPSAEGAAAIARAFAEAMSAAAPVA
jgi:acyl-CoA thioesterase-1